MAKKPQVKCPGCGQKFYREDHEYFYTGSRYYHIECYENLDEQNKLTQEIHRKMRETLGEQYSKAKVTRQINEYLTEGKTLQGILDTLNYWYDVKNSDPSKAMGGIGIVGYVYVEAQQYWLKKKEAGSRNLNIDLSCYDQPQEYNIKPTPIIKPKKVRLFDLT